MLRHTCRQCLSFQDPFTGAINETFETPYTKAQTVGGRKVVGFQVRWKREKLDLKECNFNYLCQDGGMKFYGCFVGDSCQKIGDDPVFEPIGLYR